MVRTDDARRQIRLSTASPIPSTFTRAAFPLGGIGTGTISIGARGEFRDWEVRNRADKGSVNPNTFFAISAEPAGAARVTRVIEARHSDRRDWYNGGNWTRFEGLPRLRSATMRGEYPFIEVEFEDDVLPVHVALTAFTPLIPLDADDSGIPAAVLRYRVTNPGAIPVSVTITGSLSHLAGRTSWADRDGENPDGDYATEQTVGWREEGGVRGLEFGVQCHPADLEYGTMSLLTADAAVLAMPEWPPQGQKLFWRSLSADGRLAPADPAEFGPIVPDATLPKRRTGSIGIVHELAPGETRDFEFVLSWSFPNRAKGWERDAFFGDGPRLPDLGNTRNFYATRFADAWAAGSYLISELPRLERDTLAFHDALYATTADPAVLEALSATIVALRSTTCFRVEDGTFFGWEGSLDHGGSCGGTCTHVWSYAQTVAWLFPDLERSSRRIEFLTETRDDGRQYFRANQFFGGRPHAGPPAVDGQLGTIVRLHREWRFSGDGRFLTELWPAARRALDYALAWDTDDDGALDAFMHNTYDIEFDGSEPLSNLLLLAALRAAVRMAAAAGDAESESRYAAALAKSTARIDDLLFNGEYYEQRVADIDARPNQYGSGVLSDQLLGQFQAHVNGFGFLLPEDHIKSAIHAVYAYNFRPDLSSHENLGRSYAVDDEAGLLTASWPRGGRPHTPFVYSDEIWTGIEYQVAAELVYCGFVEEGLTIVRATRARHDGRYRSPWNDIEAGNHYARSMSAWGLLLALSGAQYDSPARRLGFDPVANGTYFFSTGTGWGRATITDDSVRIEIDYGTLDVDALVVRNRDVGPVAIAAGERFSA
jgi:non-lysosomal glucosylceramidase